VNPYIDEATGTHFNKLGIRSRDELHQVEYAVTDLRIAELLVKPIPGRYDLDHLKAVHAHVFQDLYEWAGSIGNSNAPQSPTTRPQPAKTGRLRQ
jgi:cell filamentation protein